MDDLDNNDPGDYIFNEEYQEEEESGDSDNGVSEHEAEDEVFQLNLGISEELAKANYEAAGMEVEEEPETITIAGNAHLINPEVDSILQRVVEDLDMPYKPTDFQRVAVNALGDQKNVILVSPTGRD